jgi:hypothetical protein
LSSVAGEIFAENWIDLDEQALAANGQLRTLYIEQDVIKLTWAQ